MYSVRLKPFTLDELHALVFRLDIAETVEPLDEVAERLRDEMVRELELRKNRSPLSTQTKLVSSGGIVAESSLWIFVTLPLVLVCGLLWNQNAWQSREKLRRKSLSVLMISGTFLKIGEIIRCPPSDEMPEFWDSQALEEFIVKRKPEWLKSPDTADTFQGL